MIYWPIELPAPLMGTTYNPVDPQMRTTMQSGRTLARRNFTVVPVRFQARWIFKSDAQAELFEDFYRVVTIDGAEWFAMPLLLPQGRDYRSLRFIGPYSGPKRVNTPGADGDFWEYSANLEISMRPEDSVPVTPPGPTPSQWNWRPPGVPDTAINLLIPIEVPGGKFNWSLGCSGESGRSEVISQPGNDGGGLFWEKYFGQSPFNCSATTNSIPIASADGILNDGCQIWVLIETIGDPSPVKLQSSSLGIFNSGSLTQAYILNLTPLNTNLGNSILVHGTIEYAGLGPSDPYLMVNLILYGGFYNHDSVYIRYIGASPPA